MPEIMGERLKAERERRKLSYGQVAAHVGVKKPTIYAYEVGNADPSVHVLVALARMFNVSTDYLLGLDGYKSIVLRDITPEQQITVDEMVTLLIARFKADNNRMTLEKYENS